MNALMLACCLQLWLMPVAVNPASPDAAHARSLRLTIETHKDHFVLYEPVIVSYSIENPLSRPVRAIISLNYRQHAIEFTITSPAEVTTKYFGGGFADGVQVDQLHPAGFLGLERMEMVWNEETLNWAFPEPGKYVLRARMFVGDYPQPVYIEAAPRALEVTEPTGRNAEAIEYFESKDDFQSLIRRGAAGYCRGKPGPACFEELARFLHQYSDSAYAPMIARNLAGHLPVTPRVELGIQLLGEFMAKWSSHPHAPDVLYRLASALHEDGRHAEAATILRRLEKEYPMERNLLKAIRDRALEYGND